MEVTEKREPVALYQVPLLPELEVKSLIISSFPQLALNLQHIQLRKKQAKYQVFIMVPARQIETFCSQKELTLGKQKIYAKRWNTEAQIFIGRLPDSLAFEDVRASLQKQFGKISQIFQGKPHQESKTKLRHCSIQFQKAEDAQKCLFSNRKITIKDNQLRPIRTYAWNESEETDRKVWMKVTSQIQDQAQLQRFLNQQLRKEGKLRERVRLDGNKAIIQYISRQGAEKALQAFKNRKIGKYEVVVRPYANKDTHTVFTSGLKPTITVEQLEDAFKHYQPLICCNVATGKDPNIKNGTITFGSLQTFKKVFVDYKQDPKVRQLFVKQPYLNIHMTAKERNDYNNFRKVKPQYAPAQKKPIMPSPIGFFPVYPQYSQYAQIPQMPLQNRYPPGFGRQTGGFGYNNSSPFQ